MRKPKQIYKTISPDEKYHLIAEAAYFRAERRGFQGGSCTEDWLEAEREINQLYFPSAPLRGALVFLARERRRHPLPVPASETLLDEAMEVA